MADYSDAYAGDKRIPVMKKRPYVGPAPEYGGEPVENAERVTVAERIASDLTNFNNLFINSLDRLEKRVRIHLRDDSDVEKTPGPEEPEGITQFERLFKDKLSDYERQLERLNSLIERLDP